MRQNLRVSLGAVVLALATLAAVIFAVINFDQRTRFEVVYDGVGLARHGPRHSGQPDFPQLSRNFAPAFVQATPC